MGELAGKVALVTGAARGQGRSHAVALAREGVGIIAVDLCKQLDSVPYPLSSSEDLAETVRQIEALGGRVVSAEVDVRDLDALKTAVDAGVSELGRLDIVLANAGISATSQLLEVEEDAWNEMIDINLSGQWKTIKAAVPHVIAGGRGGSVVITSSLATEVTNDNIGAYTAAKFGLIGLMRVLARELAPHSIRVNTIHPTTVNTEMVLNDAMYRLFRPDLAEPTREDFDEAARTMNKLPVSALEVEDVTAAVLYLVSDAGRYVTGNKHLLSAGAQLS